MNTYSRTLELRLAQQVALADAERLVEQLRSMSCSEQRASGSILGGKLLLECPVQTYWHLTLALVAHDSRAFLVTLMKTLVQRMKRGTASLSDDGFMRLASTFNDVERQKVAFLLLPTLSAPAEVERLLDVLRIPKGRHQMVYLVRVDTLPCLFLLFRSLRYVEHNREELLLVARQLMKRGTNAGFNLASIMKVAFGLEELSGTFSLKLQPYEVARLEHSYEAFCKRVGEA